MRKYVGRRAVFPTHVGVYRCIRTICFSPFCFPHARGGVPRELIETTDELRFSPRTWGCTEDTTEIEALDRVFPTHVGVYR